MPLWKRSLIYPVPVCTFAYELQLFWRLICNCNLTSPWTLEVIFNDQPHIMKISDWVGSIFRLNTWIVIQLGYLSAEEGHGLWEGGYESLYEPVTILMVHMLITATIEASTVDWQIEYWYWSIFNHENSEDIRSRCGSNNSPAGTTVRSTE